MKYATALAVAVVLTCGSVPSAALASPYQPPGLNPGDPYHLVFLSSTTRDATSSDIADYDAHVQAAAAAAALGSVTWRAIGSTATVDAKDHAPVTAPVYRLDGIKVADDYADLWDGSPDATINLTETLSTDDNIYVWTGTTGSGDADASRYLGNGGSTNVGWTGTTASSHWTASYYYGGTGARPLYALSEELIVTAEAAGTPEPSTLLLAVLGLVGLATTRRRRR